MKPVVHGIWAALALALCLVTSGCSTASKSSDASGEAAGRQMYSPDVRGDPYARTQWEVAAQALEQECRRSGKMCEEAAQARLALSRRRSRF